MYGAGDAASRLLGFAAMPVLTALIVPADYGVLTLVTSIGALAGSLGSIGMNSALQRFYFDGDMETRCRLVATGWWLLAGGLAVAMAIVLAPAWMFASILRERYGVEGKILGLALAAMALAQLVQYGVDLFRLEFRPFAYALVQLVRGGGATLLAIVCVALFGLGIDGVLLAGVLVGGALSFGLVFGSMRRYGARLDQIEAGRLFSFGWPFVFINLSGWAYASLDRWMLASYGGLAVAGEYAIAVTLSGLAGSVVTAFAQAWSPLVFKLRSEAPERFAATVARMWELWGAALLLVGSGVMLLAPEVLLLMTAPAYHGVAPALIVLAAGVAVGGTIQMTALGISLSCRTGILAWGSGLALAANLGLNLLTIPLWGAVGAGASTLVCQIVLTALYAWRSQVLHPFPVRWWRLVQLGIAGSACLVLALVVSYASWSWWHVPAKMAVLAALASWLWLGMDMREQLRAMTDKTDVTGPC